MSKIKRALREVAKREGLSEKQVYDEIQAAIDTGFRSHDPAVQALWEAIPMPCGRPRPEDIIQYCVQKIKG